MTWKMAPTHLRSARSHCLLPALRRLEACAPAWPACFPLFPVAEGLWTRISESENQTECSAECTPRILLRMAVPKGVQAGWVRAQPPRSTPGASKGKAKGPRSSR